MLGVDLLQRKNVSCDLQELISVINSLKINLQNSNLAVVKNTLESLQSRAFLEESVQADC